MRHLTDPLRPATLLALLAVLALLLTPGLAMAKDSGGQCLVKEGQRIHVVTDSDTPVVVVGPKAETDSEALSLHRAADLSLQGIVGLRDVRLCCEKDCGSYNHGCYAGDCSKCRKLCRTLCDDSDDGNSLYDLLNTHTDTAGF